MSICSEDIKKEGENSTLEFEAHILIGQLVVDNRERLQLLFNVVLVLVLGIEEHLLMFVEHWPINHDNVLNRFDQIQKPTFSAHPQKTFSNLLPSMRHRVRFATISVGPPPSFICV